MRILKAFGLCLLVVAGIAFAKENSLGIHEIGHVKFEAAVHVGATVLPAGEYTVRHTMEGQDHIMVFKRDGNKQEFKIKCTLVQLEKSAPRNEVIYQVTADNQRVLQEMVFAGDKAKHVF